LDDAQKEGGMQDIARRLTAEFVGTFALIFIGAGSIVAFATGIEGSGLLTIALAHGLAIGVMVSAVGHVSGGHFNPAVTIGAWVTQKIPLVDAAAYIGAQLAGGIAGALLLRVGTPTDVWRTVELGTPQTAGVNAGQAVLIEAVLTFFLVWVIFATAVDPEGAFGKVAASPSASPSPWAS
jgi:aquaporin TIP